MDAVGVLAKIPSALPKTLASPPRHAAVRASLRAHGVAQTFSLPSHAASQPLRFPSLIPSSSRRRAGRRAGTSSTRVFLTHLVASMDGVEETYIMVKPDGVQRGLVGEIISRFEKKGFLLKGLKLFQCPKELAEEHYRDLKDKSFYPKLINYITSGPVVCVGVVASARKLIGATNPLQAEPGTIRGDLAVQTGRNVVHGSDSPENGHREVVDTLADASQREKLIAKIGGRSYNEVAAGNRARATRATRESTMEREDQKINKKKEDSESIPLKGFAADLHRRRTGTKFDEEKKAIDLLDGTTAVLLESASESSVVHRRRVMSMDTSPSTLADGVAVPSRSDGHS
ncbi:hypothetical protein ZIOFF_068254 [Zingiber officinale]|uniref:Nucleoside diphosphate kinase n=1 Tax=Zingiber officinale TaxID=94328 RepID=A0A8J5BLF7_ZINOF|nr:hypothetical protein ZIOFF_068254 [Zingiber officinale]